jgi:hypothetical protein
MSCSVLSCNSSLSKSWALWEHYQSTEFETLSGTKTDSSFTCILFLWFDKKTLYTVMMLASSTYFFDLFVSDFTLHLTSTAIEMHSLSDFIVDTVWWMRLLTTLISICLHLHLHRVILLLFLIMLCQRTWFALLSALLKFFLLDLFLTLSDCTDT